MGSSSVLHTTSDRPRSIAGSETFSGGLRSIMLKDTPRAFHSHLKTDKAAPYEPLQLHHSKKLIVNNLDIPMGLTMHANTYALMSTPLKLY
ncbi:uncharacterized protein EV420DRAFT_1523716 [Desarmillaria tabescens]|uniref:Uncharacterized protein n=1 Tax=Armillaria tabescens TaxID=1929756 RepID=A0AA39NAU5_ARMTA|nr:uncharacterized protein EV420DRAFT_1523716 [Desarmillaria tabescens]KAK0462235.1 hypothetical protein EV420DRAFT_1523716 [Desarmillaria tabescens]